MTGPNPTDRGRLGTKRHLVVDARGTPLGVTLSGANRHDSMMLAATLDAIPGVHSGERGRPRRRPAKLQADKAYDHRRCQHDCRTQSIAAGAWTAANAWAATAGWLSTHTPGWSGFAAWPCAMNAARTFTWPL